ncbi:MAG: DUF1800 domain-containing protein [Chitinophagaceae bacterium]|nr:DUF1800 domain-containing protein [Chitinophagaceae bacterium]
MASIAPRNGPIGFANAAHLLRRATYNASSERIKTFAGKTAAEALVLLFQFNPSQFPAPRYSGQEYIPTKANPSPVFQPTIHTNKNWLRHWWLHCALTDESMQHKLAYFLHTIFVADETTAIFTVFDHHELLKWHAKGSLKELAVRMTRNINMLFYLDNRENTLVSPNENYAREFLELFTIQKGPQAGPGNYTTYTEQDVQQAARVLTGIDGNQGTAETRLNNVDPVTQIPQGTLTLNKHDKNNKTFSAAFGNRTITGRNTTQGMAQELQELVDMVFEQQATAKSFSRRIYRFFVNRNITDEIEADIIGPMANTLMQTGYNLQAVVTQLLVSVHFYDEDDAEKGDTLWGAKVKDPLEYVLGLLNTFRITLPDYVAQNNTSYQFYNNAIMSRLLRLDLPMWRPFDVSGYPAHSKHPQYDRTWITPVSLASRYNDFIIPLIAGFRYSGFLFKFDTVLFVHQSGHFTDPSNAATLVNECYELLFPAKPQGGRHTYFMDALLGGLSTINWRNDWNNYLATNNKTTVQVALNRLFAALVRCPEYQTC